MKSGNWKNVRSRICCALLILAMVICDVPMAVYAQETDVSNIVENEIVAPELLEDNTQDNQDNQGVVLEEESDENSSESIIDEKIDSEEEKEESEIVVNEETTVETILEEDTEEAVSVEEEISEPALGAHVMKTYGDIEWYVDYEDSKMVITFQPKDGLTDVSFESASVYPWYEYKTFINKAVFKEGIKEVPFKCFYEFDRLRKVELADSIEEIGDYAFWNCERLGDFSSENEIVFPEGLKVIGNYAFCGCICMDEYLLPPHLKTISIGAFGAYKNLTHISIPASVSNIHEGFCYGYIGSGMSQDNVVIDLEASNPYYSMQDGVLYDNAKQIAIFCGKTDSDTIILRPGTKRIGAHCFATKNTRNVLYKVVMPDSVISIGYYAFEFAWIEKLKLSENLKTIEDYAFHKCNIEEIDFPDSVESVGRYVFYESYMKEATFPKNMTVIPVGMYSDTYVDRVCIPSGVEVIEERAFHYTHPGVVEVVIPKSVREIGDIAFFSPRTHIKNIYYGGTEDEWNELLASLDDASWASQATIHYYTDRVDLSFKDEIIKNDGNLKSGTKFGDIKFKDNEQISNVRISDWVNKYGLSMNSEDVVAQNDEYFAYASIFTDNYFNDGTRVFVNGEECEVFDISADGKRLSFVTPTFVSECKHARVDMSAYESDGEKHWHPCPDCGERVRQNDHVWGPDVLNAGVTTTECTVCHFEVTKNNGRMRMNKTQLSGGYYEVGETIPASFSMDESYAYSSCYELSEPTWYKGAYSESNKIDVNQGLCFQNDTYYVAFEIAIKEELADQYYLRSGGINVRFVQNGLSEETSYRVVRDDPNISGRQIQKVVFSYTPIDRSELIVVLPAYSSNLTVGQLRQNIKFVAGGQSLAPMYLPSVLDMMGNALSDDDSITRYKPYAIKPMIDVPGYIDENSIKGAGVTGCKSGGLFNYRSGEDKTGVFAEIVFYYSPKAITVANVDVEVPLAGEILGESVVARESDLFEISAINWLDEEGAPISSNSTVQIGKKYCINAEVSPKGQNVFSENTIFTVNGYEPIEVVYHDESSVSVKYEFPIVEEHVHTSTLIPMDPGNCSRKGHVEYYQCSECGRSYLDRELTQRIIDLNAWLTSYNNGLSGGMIQDTDIHNFDDGQSTDADAEFCQDCGIKNINYKGLKVNVLEAHYTGSYIDAPISVDGLSFGSNYYIAGDSGAETPGVYEAVLIGRNNYGGQRKVEWTISADGMWISFDAANSEYEYTGTQIKPSVKVYDGERRLTAGKDYAVSYKNNVNAYTLKSGDIGFDVNKAPMVIVTGKGDYSGKETANFVINPKSIDSVRVDDIYVNETGKPITIKPVVKVGNKTLVLGKDYRIYNTLNLIEDIKTLTAQGTHELLVMGTGNYQGSSLFKFNITNKSLISKCSITVKNTEYDSGRIVKPEVVITYQKDRLIEGLDYVLELENKEVGNASVRIVGKGNYEGFAVKTFKITGVPINSTKAEPIPDYEYSGNAIGTSVKLTYEKKGFAPVTLVDGRDYEFSISNNIKAGTAKVVVTGKGKYTGTKTINFKVKPYDVEKASSKIVINDNHAIVESYCAGGVKPDVPVTFDGTVLVKGVDYTCTYSNNTKIALSNEVNAPTITYLFKGNFKGKIKKTFSISRMSINNLNISMPNIVYNPKANGWISKPVIKDANGKSLVSGKDYQVSYYKDSGLSISATDADNVIGNSIWVKIEGLGSYMYGTNRSYRILKGNIATAQIKIDDIEYDPEGLTTVQKSNIRINCAGVDLQNSDYAIWEINMPADNKPGTGSVLLEATGPSGFFGRKKVNFKVVPRKTSDTDKNKLDVIGDASSVSYKKSGSKIGVSVKYNGNVVLKEGVDYSISYANISKAASKSDAKAPTVTVNFKGKYKGKQTLKYDITKQLLSNGSIYNSDVTYNSKPDGWKQTKFTFRDIEKKVLKEGTDYELVPGYYLDPGCTMPFTDSNNIVGVSVYVKLAAKAASNYQGEWIGSYKIAKGDISKAKITVKKAKNWTGTNVNLEPSDIEVSLNGSPLIAGAEWVIVECSNNIKRGTATVEVRGVGDYGGTKTANFKIIQKPFRWWNR